MTMMLLYDILGCHWRAREPISNFQFHTIQLLLVRDREREREDFTKNEEHQNKPNYMRVFVREVLFEHNRITIHLERKKNIHVENFSVHK